jgi:hypothetical protein
MEKISQLMAFTTEGPVSAPTIRDRQKFQASQLDFSALEGALFQSQSALEVSSLSLWLSGFYHGQPLGKKKQLLFSKPWLPITSGQNGQVRHWVGLAR